VHVFGFYYNNQRRKKERKKEKRKKVIQLWKIKEAHCETDRRYASKQHGRPTVNERHM